MTFLNTLFHAVAAFLTSVMLFFGSFFAHPVSIPEDSSAIPSEVVQDTDEDVQGSAVLPLASNSTNSSAQNNPPSSGTTFNPPSVPSSVTGAPTYYVDFSGGSDSNSGTSASSAWKHAPGDPNATGNPALVVLQAGNTVVFKGGVTYYGAISVKHSGTQGAPITYKGDGWGTGKAIIDGSDVLPSWTKCTSQASCAGSPHWQNIYHTTVASIPAFLDIEPAIRLNLFQNTQVIAPAQTPAATNTYYQTKDNYYSVAKGDVTSTSISDARLASLGGVNLVGSYVYVWGTPNDIRFKKITAWNASTNTISFGSIGVYTDRDTRYAIANNPGGNIFNTPGQYYFNSTKNSTGGYDLYVWPSGGANLSTNSNISISTRSFGFNLGKQNNVTIEGFLIQKQTGDSTREGEGIIKYDLSPTKNITIRNNELRYMQGNGTGAIALSALDGALIADNFIHDTLGNMRGIQVNGKDITIRNNHVRNTSRTGIYLAVAHSSIVDKNFVEYCNSTHGNGITVYQQSDQVTVSNNRVTHSNIAFTMERSSNVHIFNNLFDGSGATDKVFADWGSMSGTNLILNNTIVGSDKTHSSLYLGSGAAGNYIVENNIIDGGGNKSANSVFSHNLYTSLAWNQTASKGWSLSVGEATVTPLAVFSSGAAGNYTLKVGSPAIDSGVDLSSYLRTDLTGKARPAGKAFDIGAYEF